MFNQLRSFLSIPRRLALTLWAIAIVTTSAGFNATLNTASAQEAALFEISEGTLFPDYDVNIFSYTARVEPTVESMTVTPSARLRVNGNLVNANTPSATIDLDFGSNVITMLIAGPISTTTYVVTVTRTVPADFVTTWRASGNEAARTIVFPGTGNYMIDWGDGNIESATTPITHTYASNGDYDITVSDGITRFNLNNHADAPKLREIKQWGSADWTSMQAAFFGATNMTMSATDEPDLSRVTSTADMFRSTAAFNSNINGWDVSSVTDMGRMFQSTTIFNQDLNDWDVSSVTGMEDMFSIASAFNGAIGNWNVSAVENMEDMFRNTGAFNQDIGDWDVSAVENMQRMFSSAGAFNQDISRWNVRAVTNMTFMFSAATAFSQNLGPWYITSTPTTNYDGTNNRAVATFAAQNSVLQGHSSAYSLVGGDGNDHNGSFSINANTTLVADTGLAVGTYKVRIGTGSVAFGTNNQRAITVTVALPAMDERLSNLELSEGNLRPFFNSETTSYTASVINTTRSITVKPTTLSSSSTVTVGATVQGPVSSGFHSAAIPLVLGPTTINIVITASGSSTTQTYTVTVTREEVDPADFITTWRVMGDQAARTIIFPGEGSYTINWGDGNDSEPATGPVTHIYAANGDYDVTVSRGITRFNLTGHPDGLKLREVKQWGSAQWTTMAQAFDGAQDLNITATDAPDLSNVTSMDRMFQEAFRFNSNIGHWDMSNVTNVSLMFFNASIFNDDISMWDMGNVTDMSGMFRDADAFNQDIGGWDTSKVENMARVFRDAGGFRQDLGSWDVRSVTDMTNMLLVNDFTGVTVDPGPLGEWYIVPTAITGYTGINNLGVATLAAQNAFLDGQNPAYRLVGGSGATHNSLFEISGNSINVKNPTTITPGTYNVRVSANQRSAAFADRLFNTPNEKAIQVVVPPAPDSDAFITTWRAMGDEAARTIVFPGTGNYMIDWGDGTAAETATASIAHTYANDGDYDVVVSNGITHFNLNEHADAPKLRNVQQWGSAEWTTMERAFYGATNMTMSATDAPDLSGVTSMLLMFANTTVFNGAIGDWDVSTVENMISMFFGTDAFNQDIGEWDVSSVTQMDNMFSGAGAFNQDIGEWDVSSVVDMNNMFGGGVFNQDIGDWDVSSVTNMMSMFVSNTAFNQDISRWDVRAITSNNMLLMFTSADAFSQNLGPWYVTQTPIANYDGTTNLGVATIAAQNADLMGHNPVYSLTAGVTDNDSFSISGNVLSADAGLAANTYSVTISVASATAFGTNNEGVVSVVVALPAMDARLNTLSLSSGSLSPVFNSDVASYTASVANPISSIQVTPAVLSSTSTVTAGTTSQADVTSGSPSTPISLAVGENTVTIVVTASDTSITQTYTVTVTRAEPDPANFITTWSVSGNEAARTITFPGEGNYMINWGDGTAVASATGPTIRIYPHDGTYDITVSGGITHFNLNAHADRSKLRDVKQWGTAEWTTMEDAFYFAPTLAMSATDAPDLSNVTSMEQMFGTTGDFNGDIGHWDTSNVTNMSRLFLQAGAFNQDISGWDVSKVTNMNSMFSSARAFRQDLGSWDVRSVTDMTEMFNINPILGTHVDPGPLGEWYIVPTATTNYDGGTNRTVATIAAQNAFLDRQNPDYRLVGGSGATHNSLFEVSGNSINVKNPTTITPGTYNVRVSATMSGTRLFSTTNERAIQVVVPGPTPAMPTGLVVTPGATPASSLVINWHAAQAASAPGRSSVASYRLEYATNAAFTGTVATYAPALGASATSATVSTGLTTETVYYFRLIAIDAAGEESIPATANGATSNFRIPLVADLHCFVGIICNPPDLPEVTGGSGFYRYAISGFPSNTPDGGSDVRNSRDTDINENMGDSHRTPPTVITYTVTDHFGTATTDDDIVLSREFTYSVTGPSFPTSASVEAQTFTVGQPVSLSFPEALNPDSGYYYRLAASREYVIDINSPANTETGANAHAICTAHLCQQGSIAPQSQFESPGQSTNTPSIPPGLNFNPATRVLSGIPESTAVVQSYRYIVFNSDDASTTLSFAVTIEAGLVADAGPDQDNVAPGATVTLDGSGTAGASGGSVYAWSQTGGSGISLTNANTQTATFTAPTTLTTPTVYTFMLRVTEAGTTSTDTVEITVAPMGFYVPQIADHDDYLYGRHYLPPELPEATGGTGPYSYAITGYPATFTAIDPDGRRVVVDGGIGGKQDSAQLESPVTLTYTVTDTNGTDGDTTDDDTETREFRFARSGPSFPSGAAIAAKSYTVGVPIEETFPLAMGATPAYMYRLHTGDAVYPACTTHLCGSLMAQRALTIPDGLVFNPLTRTLSGTPTTAASSSMVHYVTADERGALATLSFAVAVAAMPDAPAVPTSFAAASTTGLSDTSVDLSWVAPTNTFDAYQLQYTTFRGFIDPTQITTVTPAPLAAATTAVVSGLSPETTYYFRLRAVNGGIGGDYATAEQATGVTLVQAAPGAPTSLTATPTTGATDTSVDVGWVAPVGTTSTGRVASYELQYSTNSGFPSSGANATMTVTPAPVSTANSATVSGLNSSTTYYFRLRAQNSIGNSGYVSAQATTAVGLVANAGNDASVQEGMVFTLDASASTFPARATSQNYAWAHASSNPVSIGAIMLSDATTATASFTAPNIPANGILTFMLTVSDDSGSSDTDTVAITVTADNDAPVVMITGGDQSVRGGVMVTLTGTATDPDGRPLTQRWRQVRGPSTPVITLSDPTALTTTFTSPNTLTTDTTYRFRLTVNDGERDGTAEVEVVVAAVGTLIPPIVDQSCLVGHYCELPALPEATGGTGPYSYTITGIPDEAPDSVSDSSRLITGSGSQTTALIAPVTATYTVTDTGDNNRSMSRQFQFSVTGPEFPSSTSVDAQTYMVDTPVNITLPAAARATSYRLTSRISVLDLKSTILSDNSSTPNCATHLCGQNLIAPQSDLEGTASTARAALSAYDLKIPEGLSFNPNTRVLSGTPVIAAISPSGTPTMLNLVALDGMNALATVSFSVLVEPETPRTVVSIAGPTRPVRTSVTAEPPLVTALTSSVFDTNIANVANPDARLSYLWTVAPAATTTPPSPAATLTDETTASATFVHPVLPEELSEADYTVTLRVTGGDITPVTATLVITVRHSSPVMEAVNNMLLPQVSQAVVAQSTGAIASRVGAAISAISAPIASLNIAGQSYSPRGDLLNGEQYSLSGIVSESEDNGVNAPHVTALQNNPLYKMLSKHGNSLVEGSIDMKNMLGNTSFVIPTKVGRHPRPALAGAGTSQRQHGGLTQHGDLTLNANDGYFPSLNELSGAVWGSGEYSNLSNEDDTTEYNGSLYGFSLGTDAYWTTKHGRTVFGVAASWSDGDFDFNSEGESGTYDMLLTSINPYYGYGFRDSNGQDVLYSWFTGGVGQGELKISNADDDEVFTSDLSTQNVAFGANGKILQGKKISLHGKGQISTSTLELDGDATGNILPTEYKTHQARLGLEMTVPTQFPDGTRVASSLEVGLRHDGGDGDTGSGIAISGGVYRNNSQGLILEGNLHALLGRNNYSEWGISGLFRVEPGQDGQGVSLQLSPGVGQERSGVSNLLKADTWNALRGSVSGSASAQSTKYVPHLKAELGVGLSSRSGMGMFTPYSAMNLTNSRNRYQLGIRWQPTNAFNLDLSGEQFVPDNADSYNEYLLKGEYQF